MDKGVDQGVAAETLAHDQLSAGINITVRGDYVNTRPSFVKINLNLTAVPQTQTVLNSVFQGAGFYLPDTGNAAIMASIGGQLFKFSIGGNLATVTNVSVPNDPGDQLGLTQTWGWQSENFWIQNDGLNLPIFYDGNFSRRSYGAPIDLGTVTVGFTAPAVGSNVVVTTSVPYEGINGIPILIDGVIYQIVSASATPGSGNQALLTNVNDVPGTVYPTGTQIIFSVSNVVTVGGTSSSNSLNYGTGQMNSQTLYDINTQQPFALPVSTPYTGPAGASVLLPWTNIFSPPSFQPPVNLNTTTVPATITAGTGAQVGYIIINFTQASPSSNYLPFGATGYFTPGGIVQGSGGGTNTVVGVLASPFTVPAVGQQGIANLVSPYTGPAGEQVYINNNQYAIVAVPPGPPTTSLTLLNLNDTSGTNHNSPPYVFTSLPELPAGAMGAYGMGRNWMALIDRRSFIAGDIVGGSSGTTTYNFRDAPLRITENSYLAGGGVFRPSNSGGLIQAMAFLATLDVSLGQGPLQIWTPFTVFSCNAPVDRTTWASVTNPILTNSLISNGALNQNGTTLANGDALFRSVDGLRSLILARRDFDTWGNVPQSREVQETLDADNPGLLNWGSSVVFNNRYLFTANPVSTPNGVYHPVTCVINFDPLSSLNYKAPSVYDGVWTGLNVLQYVTGVFSGVQRCFAFCLNIQTNNTLELWEVLLDANSTGEDNGQIPIVMDFSTGAMFNKLQNKTEFDYCQLKDGEIYVDQVTGHLSFQVFYKPDQYANWVPWFSWKVAGASSYYSRMGFGEPSGAPCDPVLQVPLRQFYTCQVRFVITGPGSCRMLGAKFKAVEVPMPEFAKQYCSPGP